MSKSKHQHKSGFTFIYSTRLKIKQCIIVELTNCCTMTAFYIICKNFELWFGIHLCIIGKKDIVILLVCQCTLCIGTDKDPTVKSSC